MRQQFALTARTLNRRHAFAISRHVSPELCVSLHPLDREGAGKAGRQPAPAVCRAKCTREKDRTAAYRCGRTLGLPCAMVGRLMPCSPGSRISFWPPSRPANGMMPSARSGSRTSPQRLDRSNDGQDHTVLPYAAHPASPGGFAGLRRRSSPRGRGLTGAPRPARTSRADAAASTASPARIS